MLALEVRRELRNEELELLVVLHVGFGWLWWNEDRCQKGDVGVGQVGIFLRWEFGTVTAAMILVVVAVLRGNSCGHPGIFDRLDGFVTRPATQR